MSKFDLSCTSFLIKMDAKKKIKNGSDTSRTEIYREAVIPTLSRDARQRLKWMEHFKKYRNARLTCRHFGISPDTFYLWQKRFDSANLLTLEDNLKTRKPHKTRLSKHVLAHLETVKKLKSINPRLGKIRLTKILKETGYSISPATVSRILKKTKNIT